MNIDIFIKAPVHIEWNVKNGVLLFLDTSRRVILYFDVPIIYASFIIQLLTYVSAHYTLLVKVRHEDHLKHTSLLNKNKQTIIKEQ